MAKKKGGGINPEQFANKIRTKVEEIKPKLTYQFAVGVDVLFISKLKWGDLLDAGIQDGNQIIQTQLTKALDEAIEASIWKWTPGVTTKRKNGEQVTSPRNILDTGELKNSLRMNIKGNSINVAYRRPGSLITHYGGYIRPYGNKNAAKVYLPPRPWVRSVMYGENGFEAFPFNDIWKQAIKNKFKS